MTRRTSLSLVLVLAVLSFASSAFAASSNFDSKSTEKSVSKPVRMKKKLRATASLGRHKSIRISKNKATLLAPLPSTLSVAEKAALLGLVAESTQAPKQVKNDLQHLLVSTTYAQRVSVTEFRCKRTDGTSDKKVLVRKSVPINCTVHIGTEAMNEDDSGWSSHYQLLVDATRDEKGAIRLRGVRFGDISESSSNEKRKGKTKGK